MNNDQPKLFFIKQTTPVEEKCQSNGIVELVNVVVKGSPFTFQVGLTGYVRANRVFNFNHITIQTKLVYDGDEDKEVDFVKTKPLESKPKISPSGEYAYLELRIQVLSSQHEDSFFRIKVIALDPVTGREFDPPINVVSNPIKVISKPGQQKQKRKLNSVNDVLLEAVRRVETQQDDQQKKISKLFELIQAQQQLHQQQLQHLQHLQNQQQQLSKQSLQKSNGQVPVTSTPSTPQLYTTLLLNGGKSKEAEADSLEQSFNKTLTVFRQVPQEERAVKLRKLVHQSPRDFNEVFDALAEAMGKQSEGSCLPVHSTPLFGLNSTTEGANQDYSTSHFDLNDLKFASGVLEDALHLHSRAEHESQKFLPSTSALSGLDQHLPTSLGNGEMTSLEDCLYHIFQ